MQFSNDRRAVFYQFCVIVCLYQCIYYVCIKRVSMLCLSKAFFFFLLARAFYFTGSLRPTVDGVKQNGSKWHRTRTYIRNENYHTFMRQALQMMYIFF